MGERVRVAMVWVEGGDSYWVETIVVMWGTGGCGGGRLSFGCLYWGLRLLVFFYVFTIGWGGFCWLWAAMYVGAV